jgi:rhodanese-related sulfurtransferase
MKKTLIVLVLFLLAAVAGCAKVGEGLKTYSNLSVDQLNGMMAQKDFFLVDVHVPRQEHIPGTDLFVPFDQIEANKDKFPADKDMTIVVYCRSGNMSQESSQKLAELGYTRVYNLVGGIQAWNQAGY